MSSTLESSGYQVSSVLISGYEGQNECRFRNCIFIKVLMMDKTKRSIMMFENGYMQVAGCKSSEDAGNILQAIKTSYEQAANVAITSDMQLCCRLINSNFKINHGIDCDKIISCLTGKVKQVIFDRDRHSAINVSVLTKAGATVKVLIFMKGNIIITGAKDISHVDEVYQWMTTFLTQSYQDISSGEIIEKEKIKKRPGRKRKADAETFYNGLDL